MFQPIEIFLLKLKQLTAPDELPRKMICQAVEEICHIKLGVKEVLIRNSVAHINPTHPTIKSEIFLHKKDILSRIKKLLNKNSLLDILDIR